MNTLRILSQVVDGGIVIFKGLSILTENFNRLCTGPTNFKAELLAIANSCDIVLNQHTKLSLITHYICTNSEAVILSLTSSTVNSNIVQLTLTKLHFLSQHSGSFRTSLPGIIGNEKADILANTGSKAPLIGSQLVAPFSRSFIKDYISNLLKQKKIHRILAALTRD